MLSKIISRFTKNHIKQNRHKFSNIKVFQIFTLIFTLILV